MENELERTGLTAFTESLLSIAAHYPVALFLLIAILPAAGVPNCPLMIGGGAIVARACGMPTAMAMVVGGVIANVLWSYWVAAYPLRKILWNRIEDMAPRFAAAKSRSVLLVTFLLHVTPGVPLFVQNYYPGIHRLPYWQYLCIAVPVQSLYAALIVYTSGSVAKLMNPAWMIAVLAVAAIWTWVRGLAPIPPRPPEETPALVAAASNSVLNSARSDSARDVL